MSFILDALRKSESERQRDTPPTLARAPLAQVRHRIPVWTWALIAVLLAALVALGVVWWQGRANEPAETAPDRPAASEPGRLTDSPPRATEAEPAGERLSDAPAPVRSINELARFGPSLPDYRLELLAHNGADPAASWARINGRRYVAGDTIGGGPELVEIRSDGVVLGFAGERFLLMAR
ncbi:MAG TPA: general secretion pathway protein GspB [Gammaproteobacteria bacterium]|nr:general secretion pathway protein GspB [Gammaproteobacteria bacterium]